MELVRRISALTLVLTLSLVGIPLPAHAAGDEPPAVAGDRTLMFRGQPLWQFLYAPSGKRSRASVVEQTDGQIRGVLLDGDGQPLAAQPVQLSRPSRSGPGRLTVLTDATGAFSYTGLGPGRYYEVQYRVDDEVIARSERIILVAGAMQVTGITVPPPAQEPSSAGKFAAYGAGIGGAVGWVMLMSYGGNSGGFDPAPEAALPVGLAAGSGALVGCLIGK